MKTINRIVNVCYSVGAAIVIFGAWCKILHKPGANFFLTLGLLTEVTIFIIYAVMEWFNDGKQEQAAYNDTHGVIDTDELTSAVKETNFILKSVFKVN